MITNIKEPMRKKEWHFFIIRGISTAELNYKMNCLIDLIKRTHEILEYGVEKIKVNHSTEKLLYASKNLLIKRVWFEIRYLKNIPPPS